jgi:hypothetical protein
MKYLTLFSLFALATLHAAPLAVGPNGEGVNAAAFRTALGATATGTSVLTMSAPGNDYVLAWNGSGVLTPVTKASLVSGYAPLASPTFTGTVEAGSIITSGGITATGGHIVAGGVVQAGSGSSFEIKDRSRFSSSSDGVVLLSNNAAIDFNRLQLGGTTSGYPAIKRNGTGIDFRLADDSANANITAGNITASGTVTASGALYADATVFLTGGGGNAHPIRVGATNGAASDLILTNSDYTNFGRIQLGGTTSSFPAIKRNGTAINIRLADDSADAPLTCSNLTASGNLDLSGGINDTSSYLPISMGGTLSHQMGTGYFNIVGNSAGFGVGAATDTVISRGAVAGQWYMGTTGGAFDGGLKLANIEATGTVTVPDAALSVAKTSGLQTALDGKVSNGVTMLDRFDRYPAGTVFEHGATTAGGVTSPETGNQWRYSQCSKPFTVNTGTDVVTSTGHGYSLGVPVTVLTDGTLPAPLSGVAGASSTTYYVIAIDANTFKLATSSANATAGTAIDITTSGSGTHSIGAGPIITSDGGLRFFPGELGYIGTDAGEDIKSLTIELKWDQNTGGANVRNGLTMGFSKDPILFTNWNGILPTGIIHTQLTNGGVATNDIYGVGALGTPIGETFSSPFPWGNQTAGGGVPWGMKHTIRFEFEGDEMRIIAFGKTHRWKNAMISTAGYRHWWMEAYGFSLAQGETPTFYRVWINAPRLDNAAGWGVQSPSEVLNQLSTGGPVELPQAIIRLKGNTTATPFSNPNVPLHVKGTTVTSNIVTGGGLVSDGKIRQGSPFANAGATYGGVASSFGKFTSAIASTAGTDQAFNIAASMGSFPLEGKTVGDVQEWTIYASLGANGNTKQLKLIDWLSNVRLTTPATTQNGGTMKVKVRQQVLTGTSHDFQFETTLFDSSGVQQSNTFTRTSLNYGQTYFGGSWLSTGAAAGDITVFGGTNIYYPCGD